MSILFYKVPFKFPEKCFIFRLELVDEFTEIVPSTFEPFIGHHKVLFAIFIIKVFRTIVFIFIVISTMFQPICPPAFFRCLSNSGTFTELRTTSFIETTGVTCSDSVCHNRVQVLSIPVYYSPVVRIEPATFR